MAASNLRVALMLCLNLFSSLSIVFVNKVRLQSPVEGVFNRPRHHKMPLKLFIFSGYFIIQNFHR